MASKAPSAVQLDVLRRIAADPTGRIFRMAGGFWTTRATPTKAHDTTVPTWSVSVQTVRAMEARGWLRRTNTHAEEWRDEREPTEAGRALS